ncbi:hypothetical protein FRB91_010979 [Serendipita sp. 411]|nr:hypothetical protein FRB91_010979 [Serendipita sp. 411]
MPITILPGVIYRIQSVDYGTYLERRNDDSLVMRPDKPDSISQRWFLRPSADGSVFKVESADTDQRGFMKAASISKNQLSIINQSRGDHREWQIVSKGNGKCTIYNQHNKSYLNAVENSDGHWVVIFSQTANNAEWDIKKNSDFTYTISIERILRTPKHQHTQPFALTLKEKSVILKPAKEAHNQMWLIELSDATLGPVDEPDTDADHILPNLATGEYLVKNAANSHYIRFKANTAVGTGASQFMGGSLTSKTRLKLSKVGDKGASLSCNVQGIIGNLGIKNGQVVNESMTLTIENGPIAGQYYITDGNGNAIADNNSDTLVVNQKGAGSLWVFEGR